MDSSAFTLMTKYCHSGAQPSATSQPPPTEIAGAQSGAIIEVMAPIAATACAILGSVSQRWTEVNGALEREFRFDDFAQALAFVNRVGELAEAADHHPDIELRYNRVTLRWWTHSAGGITDRDRELAARTSELV